MEVPSSLMHSTERLGKPPVRVLCELASMTGLQPEYVLMYTEMVDFRLRFCYLALVADAEAAGLGNSKKKAKNDAASNLLKKIIMTNNTLGGTKSPALLMLKIPDNAAGALHELCFHRYLPQPTYHVRTEGGISNRRFVIECSLLRFRYLARGSTKSEAKRLAARQMYDRIISMPLANAPGNLGVVCEAHLQYCTVTNSEVCIVTPSPRETARQLFGNMTENEFRTLRTLLSVPLHLADIDCEQYMKNIALSLKFNITYIDHIKETDGQGYCTVAYLSTDPPCACFGQGETPEKSKLSACDVVLKYIKYLINTVDLATGI